MKKTCSICGIVDENHICPYKKSYTRTKKDSKANRFRKSKLWTNKSREVRERDNYLCVVCSNELYNTVNMYNYKGLEVHHITPIEEDYTRRLDNDNLITLCQFHHKLAEKGKIPRKELYDLVKKQEN